MINVVFVFGGGFSTKDFLIIKNRFFYACLYPVRVTFSSSPNTALKFSICKKYSRVKKCLA